MKSATKFNRILEVLEQLLNVVVGTCFWLRLNVKMVLVENNINR